MFRNMLVPLDGSELAEEAPSYTVAVARPAKAIIHLPLAVPLPSGSRLAQLRAAGPLRRRGRYGSATRVPRERDGQHGGRDQAHPDAGRRAPPAAGILVEVVVVFGRPAGGILRYAQDKQEELIVMCPHRKGGPDPYAYGPMADHVGRRAIAPVVFVGPAEIRYIPPSPQGLEDERP